MSPWKSRYATFGRPTLRPFGVSIKPVLPPESPIRAVNCCLMSAFRNRLRWWRKQPPAGGDAGYSGLHHCPRRREKRGPHHHYRRSAVCSERCGIDSKLLSAAEIRLLQKKLPSPTSKQQSNNLPALAFYKRHNYFLLKTLPCYYSNGVDAFVLQKDLLSSAQAS